MPAGLVAALSALMSAFYIYKLVGKTAVSYKKKT